LQALETVVEPGQTLFDLGTGSGILAIGAAKLGASRILAVDIDEVAIRTAVANAQLNQYETELRFETGTLESVTERPWDIVVVNILAPVIIGLLNNSHLMDYVAPGGKLILSGIIDEQAEAVRQAVAAAGGQVEETLSITDWVAIVATRP